jgi:hypothetical protein
MAAVYVGANVHLFYIGMGAGAGGDYRRLVGSSTEASQVRTGASQLLREASKYLYELPNAQRSFRKIIMDSHGKRWCNVAVVFMFSMHRLALISLICGISEATGID